MKKYGLLLCILIVCNSAFNQDLIINFDFDKFTVNDNELAKLRNKLSKLKSSDSIVITGYTDTVGSSNYNLRLSRKRAENIKNWLSARNIGPDIMITRWNGEADNISKIDALNRRVEIYAYKEGIVPFQKSEQTFCIDNSKDTTIYGSEGTRIRIPAHSIITPVNGGPPNYLISLNEYYSLSDIIAANLTTRTSSELLETGGMIHLNIRREGKPCIIDADNPPEIGIPHTGEEIDSMALFYGKAGSQDEIIWTQSDPDYQEAELELIYHFEDMPKFRSGGLEDFRIWIGEHIHYPEFAQEKGYCGRVFVSFTVDTNGSVIKPKIVRGSYPSLNAEALRVISSSPSWVPGKRDGKNVRVEMTVPVTFVLKGGLNYYIDSTGMKSDSYTDVNDSSFQEATAEEISYYSFSILRLGWINCDRYIFKDRPRTTLKVQLKASGNISTHLIFTRYNSVLNGVYNNGYLRFSGVPVNEKVIILSVRKMNGRIYLAELHCRVSDKIEKLDDYREISYGDLKNKILELDREF